MSLEEQLKRDEGLRLTPYRDSVGKITIGYGRCLDTAGISKDEAEYLLANDISKARIAVARSLPWSTEIAETRQAVLVNMAFNMGIGGLLGFNRMLEAAEAGKYDDAADAMVNSKWASQVGDRAKRLAAQMRTGQWT